MQAEIGARLRRVAEGVAHDVQQRRGHAVTQQIQLVHLGGSPSGSITQVPSRTGQP